MANLAGKGDGKKPTVPDQSVIQLQMIVQIPNRNLFTAPALKRWDKIPTSIQAKLLGNVWCGACSKAVYILVESGKIKNNDLILTGRCAYCGGPVARLVEGDYKY